MTPTFQQRWRLFLASLHHKRKERELLQWLALKTTSDLIQIVATHSAPAVQAELRRRGLG